MIRTFYRARKCIHLKEYKKIKDNYIEITNLPTKEKALIEDEFNRISNLETPHLALKRHGTIPGDDWLEQLYLQHLKRQTFFSKYPYLKTRYVLDEFKSIIDNDKAIFKNEPRAGRSPINVVNVLGNDSYLVFIYNRLVNSSQTEVVFSAVPIIAINEIRDFGFLINYLPERKHLFDINISEYYLDLFPDIKHNSYSLNIQIDSDK